MKKLLSILCLALFTLAIQAKADNVQTIGEYNGTAQFNDPGPYQPTTIIGSFTILPGDSAITIFGTFGNSVVSSSAGLNLFLGNILVAQCIQNTACYNDGATFTDSLTAAQIATLGTGMVNLRVTQTSQFVIRLGVTTLDQAPGTAVTPEPSSIILVGTGVVAALAPLRRRFFAS